VKLKNVSGENPEVVEIKPNWVHNVKNIGVNKMKLLVFVNEIFNPDDSDTFPADVQCVK